MARISLVGVGALSASTASPQTPAVPRGTQANDVMVLVIAGRPSGTAGSNDAITPPGGWTQRGSRVRHEIGTDDLIIETWYKVAGSGETAPSITAGDAFTGGTSEGWSTFIATFRGVNTTTPFDDNSQVTGDAAAATTHTPSSYTTATAKAMALSIVATADDNNLGLNTAQGFLLAAGGTSYHTASGSDHAVGLAIKEQVTAGSVTQPTWNQGSNGSDAWVAVSDALRPAAVTYLIEETWFNATNGSAWDTALWNAPTNAGTASSTTQNVSGRQTTGGAWSAGWTRLFGTTSTNNADFEATFSLRVVTAANHYPAIGFRTSSSWSGGDWPTDGYMVEHFSDEGKVNLGRMVSGVRTDLNVLTHGLGAPAAGDVCHFRVRMEGSALKVRYWRNESAEPSTWSIEETDANHSSGRMAFVCFGSASGRISEYIHLRVTDLSGPSAVNANAGHAAVSATAYAVQAALGVYPALASVAASGFGASVGIGARAGVASVSASASGVSASIASGAGAASVAAAAANPAAALGGQAGAAAVTATAYGAGPAVGAAAGAASVAGSASGPSAALTVGAGHAAATADGFNPTVSTATAIQVNAGHAAVTGAGYGPSPAIASTIGHASVTASGFGAGASIAPRAGQAAVTASGFGPRAGLTANAGQAAVTASAYGPRLSIGPTIGHAAVTAAGFNAGASIAPRAGHAAVTAAGFGASIGITVNAAAATVTVAGFNATANTVSTGTAHAGHAAVSAAGFNVAAGVGVRPSAASVTAAGHNALAGVGASAGAASVAAAGHNVTAFTVPTTAAQAGHAAVVVTAWNAAGPGNLAPPRVRGARTVSEWERRRQGVTRAGMRLLSFYRPPHQE